MSDDNGARVDNSKRCALCGRPIPPWYYHCDVCFGTLNRWERCEEKADRDEAKEADWDRRYRR